MIRESRSHGVTLTELLVVITLLGTVAVAAVPSLSVTNTHKLDLAAAEVADAIRHARNEAIRRGAPVGFRNEGSGKMDIDLYRLDTATTPATPVYDIEHPFTHGPYEISLGTHPYARMSDLTYTAEFYGTCTQTEFIYFDSSGVPRCGEPDTVLLKRYEMTVIHGDHARVVTLEGITGRVTVQ